MQPFRIVIVMIGYAVLGLYRAFQSSSTLLKEAAEETIWSRKCEFLFSDSLVTRFDVDVTFNGEPG
jgi:hypothetical protein